MTWKGTATRWNRIGALKFDNPDIEPCRDTVCLMLPILNVLIFACQLRYLNLRYGIKIEADNPLGTKFDFAMTLGWTHSLKGLNVDDAKNLSHEDLKKITNNFSDPIGRVGHALLFRRFMDDGQEVTVKT
ncbi:hypothetical protein BC332_15136 [Capsicum chinense]|nr:hypothetical protein BC332_15136 [Capsicum chinense]